MKAITSCFDCGLLTFFSSLGGSVFHIQPSAGSVVFLTKFVRTLGFLCCWTDGVKLITETFAWSCLHRLHLWAIVFFLFRVRV